MRHAPRGTMRCVSNSGAPRRASSRFALSIGTGARSRSSRSCAALSCASRWPTFSGVVTHRARRPSGCRRIRCARNPRRRRSRRRHRRAISCSGGRVPKSVAMRVSPPIWPEKHPHGTSRPRTSQVKRNVRSPAALRARAFAHRPAKAPARTATTASPDPGSGSAVTSIEQRVGEDVHVHEHRLGDHVAAAAAAALGVATRR